MTSLVSDYSLFSLKTSISYFRFLIFSIGVSYFIFFDTKFTLKFFYVLLSAFFILLFDGYYQYFTGFNIFSFELHPGPRVSSFFGDELILGSYLSRLLPLLFGLYIYNIENFSNKRKLIGILIGITLILSECLVFLSGERSAFFFINLSAIYMIMFLKGYKLVRIFTLSISFILILIIVTIQPNSKNRIVDLTFEQLGVSKEQKTKDENSKIIYFSELHDNYFRTSFNIFKSNYFFGAGPKTYRKNCSKSIYLINEKSCSTHPHNTYLQLLSETGLIGFFLIFSLFLSIIFFSLREILLKKKKISTDNKTEYNFTICIYACFLISLWPFIPTGNFFNNWLSIIYYLPLGFFIPLIYKDLGKNFKL